MNWRIVQTVWHTELLHALRDRRTWIAMILVPLLLVPLLTVVASVGGEAPGAVTGRNYSIIAVLGAEGSPSLMEFLHQVRDLQVTPGPKAMAALETGEVDAVLEIPSGFDGALATGQRPVVTVVYDDSRLSSQLAEARVRRALAEYSQRALVHRLQGQGIEPNLLTLAQTRSHSIQGQEPEHALFLVMLMPMVLGVWSVMGGMYAAIDAVAGEKERGTLAALLATPSQRMSLVMGKYLAVVVTALVAAGAALVGMYLALWFTLGSDFAALAAVLSLGEIFLIFLTALSLAGLFSAIELMISAWARSFREAQTYLSPLSILVVLPGVLLQYVDPSGVSSLWYALPLVNGLLTFKAILLSSVHGINLAVTLVSSALYILLALRWTKVLFSKESVIFRR
ncbi:MAG: ABC transporter permease [Firmicutes bacterium]|nr:ABC transporter permease [Bacillota bacterium]